MNSSLRMFVVTIVVVVVLSAVLFWPRPQQSDDVRELFFYCAAGIKPPIEATIKEYEKTYGVKIRTDYRGSGALLSAIEASKRGDLYLAADASYIEIARKKGLAAERLPVARLRPVIGVAAGNPKKIQSIADLMRPDVRFGMANPEAASVGKQTKRILTATGEWEALEPTIKVYKPTVTEIDNDVKLGAIDAGIIWDATANQYPEIDLVAVDAFDAKTLNVTISVLTSCEQPAAALRFARFLQARDRGMLHFEKHGYQTVDGDPWEPQPHLVLYSGGVNRMAIEETIGDFEKREGVKITSVFNGCGILTAQMKTMKGSKDFPDAYFSCDVSFMNQVEGLFLAPRDISETDMVVVVPKGNPKNIAGLETLAGPGLKIGVAHPSQSALGALTKSLLEESDLYSIVHKNVRVEVPTADMLVNQLKTGALDAAIVYEANTSQVRDAIDVLPIEHARAKAIQPFAVSRASKHKYLSERFQEALLSRASKDRFEHTGFRWLSNDAQLSSKISN